MRGGGLRGRPRLPGLRAGGQGLAGRPVRLGLLATDVAPVLQQAANEVWSGWGYGEFSQEAIWAATIEPGLTAGKTIVSMLPAWQSAITDYASSDGCRVSQ
jgi:hypothetical protein